MYINFFLQVRIAYSKLEAISTDVENSTIVGTRKATLFQQVRIENR